MADTTTFNQATNRSTAKISITDLNYALQHNEKLEKLPDTIETNVIYRLSLASNTKDAYKSDPFSWKNTRSIPYPARNPEFIKIYYSCLNSEKKKDGRCVKHVYISKTNDFDVLVCYLGNLDIAIKHSHGNCKLENSHVLHHTSASTIQQIDQLVTKMSGDAAYKTLIATNCGEDAPRNSTQCQYRRKKYLKNQKITEDEIRNIILLSYELDSFYKLLQVQPQLIIVLMHDQMKQQFLNLTKVSKEKIPLYYDTTFSLGEIYVSILSFRHVMFSERPMLPLAILMHDTKREYAHDRIAHMLNIELPDLHKKCLLVTDCEIAFKNAFQKYYPPMLQLRCWNHALKDIKRGAKKYFYPEEETNPNDELDEETNKKEAIANLMDTIKDLLRAPSRADYLIEYNNISTSWPQKFRHYFETYYAPTIDELGGWSSRELNLFDEISGVTSNPSESVNAVFKRWLSWKELSLDGLVQMFYLVLGFYVNEVRRGFCGYGDYHLKLMYNDLKTDRSLLTLVSGFSPDDAVQRMKSILLKRQTSVPNVNPEVVDVEKQLSMCNLNNSKDHDDVQEQPTQQIGHDETCINCSSQKNQSSSQQETLTNTARAALVLEQDLVQYHISTKAFTVRSLDHQLVHAVHMNDPKRLFRCSCPSTLQSCSHILAVKLFLGMPVDNCDKKVNLGHERKRKRIEDKIKKPGGKRPRRCDKEPTKMYTSSYFESNQTNTTNASRTSQGDMASQVHASINVPSTIRALTDVSNLPSSSSTVNVTPKVVKAIRFLTPINLNVPSQQSNQYIVLKPS